MDPEFEAQLREAQEEERCLEWRRDHLEEEARAASELLAASRVQEQHVLQNMAEMARSSEELMRRLRQIEDPREAEAHSSQHLELEERLAEESVAAAEASLEASRRRHAASHRADSQREAARAANASAASAHTRAEVMAKARAEEAAAEERWTEAVRRAQQKVDEDLASLRRQAAEDLVALRHEADEEAAELSRDFGSPEEELAKTEGALAEVRGQAAKAEAEAQRLATSLRRRRKDEMAMSMRVEQLKAEALSLQELSASEARLAQQRQAELEAEEARKSSETARLLDELHRLQAATLPRTVPAGQSMLSPILTCQEAVAQLRRAVALAEAATLVAGEEGDPEPTQDHLQGEEALEDEVSRLQVEQQQLVELGNELRAALRADRGTASQAPCPPEPRTSEADAARPLLLRAALRALVEENRDLQAQLSQAAGVEAGPGPAASRPSILRPSSASRGNRLGKAGSAGEPCKMEADERPPSPPLELRGLRAPTAAATSLPGPGGYLRQPLAPDDAVRPPRSATDRGTASQRKALERLRAVQAKQEEALEARAEERQKLLPLIRWREAATADAAAADRQDNGG